MSPFYAAAVATDNASASALAEITAWKRHLPGMESLLDLLRLRLLEPGASSERLGDDKPVFDSL